MKWPSLTTDETGDFFFFCVRTCGWLYVNADDDPMERFRVNIITRFSGHQTVGSMNVTQAVWDQTGQRLASGGYDGSLRIWNVNTATAIHTIKHAHNGSVVDKVVWTVTNERVVTCGRDRTVRVWDPIRGIVQCLWLLRPPARVASLAVNALGTQVRYVQGCHMHWSVPLLPRCAFVAVAVAVAVASTLNCANAYVALAGCACAS